MNTSICCPLIIFYLRIKTRYLTINDLNIYLMRHFPELDQVSQTTIISSLKDDFNISYKQLHRKLRQAFCKPNERAFSIAVNIKKYLTTRRNLSSCLLMSFLSVTEHLRFMAVEIKEIQAEFLVFLITSTWAFSVHFQDTILRDHENDETKNSRKFIYFMKNVIQFRNQKANLSKRRLVIFFFDNVSIHKSEDVVEFISKLW